MGLLDYTYRLKPAAGHTAPRNELNTGQTLTGGTITLVDLGGGAFTWEFSGAAASGPMPAFTAPYGLGATGGITLAIRTRNVVNHTDTGLVPLVGVGDTTSLVTDGTYLGQTGVGTRRARATSTSSLCSINMGTVGFTEKTFVFRVAANSASSTEVLQVWEEGIGSGSTADYTSAAANLSNLICDTVVVNAGAGATIRVSDLVFWPEALTEAQCRSIAADVNAALAAPAAPVITGQPSSQTVTSPATATFSVTATGATSYQWKRNGAAISGEVASSYTTPATSVSGGSANSGDSYTVDAINITGAVTSSVAVLTVNAAPATATTLTGPSGGQVSAASGVFTVGANGAITGTVTVTPSDGGDGGTFTPTSVAISSGTPTATFTYTPGSVGAKTISISDTGSLTDATPLTYTATLTSGTLTSSPLKNNTGTVLAAVAFEAYVSNPTSGALVVKKTGLTSNGGGVISFSDGAVVAATSYRVVWRRTDTGAEGLETLTGT